MATKKAEKKLDPDILQLFVSHELHVPGPSLHTLLKLYIHLRMNGENYM